jgi:hypothetical protein
MSMQEVFFLIIIVVFGLLIWLLVPQLMIKHAIKNIISIFLARQALDIVSAKTPKELGLEPSPFSGFGLRRDWKPNALNELLKAGIILTTDDGRLYLSERKLLEIK